MSKKTAKKIPAEKKKLAANTANLAALFSPHTIAVIGASNNEKSVGYAVLKSLARGGAVLSENTAAFSGTLFAVNPVAEFILGYKCYKSVLDIAEPVDAAVICVPVKSLVSVVKDCAKKNVKVALILSAGGAESGDAGKKIQDQVVALARQAKMRILGPNSLGILRPSFNINASFAVTMPKPGPIALISQSGSLINVLLTHPAAKRCGFSCIASYGAAADITETEIIAWLLDDIETKAIALYTEHIRDGRAFMAVAEQVGKIKPIIALKGGTSMLGSQAVAAHQGSTAGNPLLYEAAFAQCGVISVHTLDELFILAKTAAWQPPCSENSIAVVTNSGASAVLAADYCKQHGVHLASLKDTLIKKLSSLLAPLATHSLPLSADQPFSNPLDLGDDALAPSFKAAISTLLDHDAVHGVIIIHTLQAMSSADETARVLAALHHAHPGKPLLTVHLGNSFSKETTAFLEEQKIPYFNELHQAVTAMKMLVDLGVRNKK